MKEHQYPARVVWTGNQGTGTSSYTGYTRHWTISTPGKPDVSCSNDPLLGGDPSLHNPEDLLISTVSACHMLWYLHLASSAGINVSEYTDDPIGYGESEPSGAGRFLRATLHPQITVAKGTDVEKADAIHGKIHRYCFIARSVKFPISVEARYQESEL